MRTFFVLGLLALPAFAQFKDDCGGIFHPPPPKTSMKETEACLTDFFTARPVHITVKSIVPGGGFGVGPTFNRDLNSGQWQNHLNVTGGASFRQFWETEALFTATHTRFGANNSARDRFRVNLFAKARDLPLMPFYGIGSNTTQ